MNDLDPYRVLSVPPGADTDTVRRAWRAAARRWHPDSGTDPDTDQFMAAKQAYEQLRSAAPTPPRRNLPRRPGTGNLPDHDPFRYQPGRCAPGLTLTVNVSLSRSEAAAGGQMRLPLTYPLTCTSCAGVPTAPVCPLCNGTGQVPHRAAVTVTWEAGTFDGQRWRVPRAGGPGHGGGPPGDLQVHAHVGR